MKRRLAFAHVWRQASSKAHKVVRASAHCVRAVLVVRVIVTVESAVRKVFIFSYILIIRSLPLSSSPHDFRQHVRSK